MNHQDLTLSNQIEDLLVSHNLRGMKHIQSALTPGYYLRAARLIHQCNTGTVLIGTGFPVANTFETDGPVGAIALYTLLEYLGATPIFVCGSPLSKALMARYRVHEINVNNLEDARRITQKSLSELQPELIISIERPGLSDDNGYFNMRGEDISDNCACFDYFMTLSSCPTIGIGDGGNEIGMGNVNQALTQLDITPSITSCDELLIADVSNWAAYGIMALISTWQGENLFAYHNRLDIMTYISQLGGIDGITHEKTLTEDGLSLSVGEDIIENLKHITGFIE